MAKSERRMTKGFGFYLLMLILILVAAFFIIVCIMTFSPKKVILGYQFYTYSDQYVVSDIKENENTENPTITPLAFNDFSSININCKTSKVTVFKSTKEEKDSIVLVNKASGFAKWSDNVDYSYKITREGDVLNIVVNEPQGFLNFNYDMQIAIRVSKNSNYDFSHTNFNITTTTGPVIVGSEITAKEFKPSFNIENLSIMTEGGNVRLTKDIESTFSNLFVTTGSGSFSTDIAQLNVSDNIKMTTSNGRITLQDFAYTNHEGELKKKFELNVGDGAFKANDINASLSFVAHNGSIEITKVHGDFDGNETSEKINNANIKVGEILGDVSLLNMKDSNIVIDKTAGQVNIETTNGNITVGKNNSGLINASWLKTKGGNINAIISDDNSNQKHYYTTETGNINLTFVANINSQNVIDSVSGNVNFQFESKYKFLLVLKDANEKPYETLNEKLKLDFITEGQFENPMYVNDYSGSTHFIDISTNGIISANLIAK